VSCISAHDPQLVRLADAIAQRVGAQRFNVWFTNSTKLDLKQDELEISVPNDFISDWIDKHYTRPIQEAANEVLGQELCVRFSVVPQLFDTESENDNSAPVAARANGGSRALVGAKSPAVVMKSGTHRPPMSASRPAETLRPTLRPNARPASEQDRESIVNNYSSRARLRHDLDSYIVGHGNQLAFNAAVFVSEYPGAQYNPLFVHGSCGLGKSHLLQGLCKRFIELHPTKRWMYLTGEEFTNEFLTALRNSRVDAFRRKMRDLELLVIDDVHFMAGKTATQEEFLHTFNAIEAMGKQVVLASDNHPKLIERFGESLVNRFMSGMVVRVDPPNFAMRCDILKQMSHRGGFKVCEDVITWIARRVTQNVRELEGSLTKVNAHMQMSGQKQASLQLAQEALGDLDRLMVQPVRPDNILLSVCHYFGLDHKDLMSGRRQRTISLARSVAMFLVRKTAKLSFPEIGMRMGKRNHSTVISACRRIERAVLKNEMLAWTSNIGERSEEAQELIQRLEDAARALN